MKDQQLTFNDEYRKRTMPNALTIMRFYCFLRTIDELRVAGKQLQRSASSVAANFRAACRARSEAEHYSKLSIVVEECDETLFWLEFIEASGRVPPSKFISLKTETLSILMVMSKARKNIKSH